MDSNGSIVVMAAFFLGVIIAVCWGLKKREPPKNPDQDKKDAAAIELLKGGNAEEIAKREGVSPEDIENWKKSFLDDALDFAKHKNEYKARCAEREHEIKWFEGVCAKHIGADWKNITEYDKRNR